MAINGPSAHLEPDHIGREANARQHAVNAATGATPDLDAQWLRCFAGVQDGDDRGRMLAIAKRVEQLERELVACGKELIATHGRWQDAAAQSLLDSPAFTVTAQEKAGDTVSPLESAGNRTSEMSASQATRTEQMSATRRMLTEEDWRLVSTAELHLRTWATSKNREPYANTLDVAQRLDALLIRALKNVPVDGTGAEK